MSRFKTKIQLNKPESFVVLGNWYNICNIKNLNIGGI